MKKLFGKLCVHRRRVYENLKKNKFPVRKRTKFCTGLAVYKLARPRSTRITSKPVVHVIGNKMP
jgi:hypothetical protein